MEPWKKARDEYRHQPIPAQLDARVRQALDESRRLSERSRFRWKRTAALIGAAACFTVMMHTSPVFAESVSRIPILGELLRIVTFTTIDSQDEAEIIHITLPKVEHIGNPEFEQEINQNITAKLDELAALAKTQADELRRNAAESEPYNPVEFYADYTVYSDQGQFLSFSIDTVTTMASAYEQRYYFNLDLSSGRELKLSDILSAEELKTADQEVRDQIAQRLAQDASSYFAPGEEGCYEGLKEDQAFYISADQKLVLVFSEYEIAPGATGTPEFVMDLPLSLNNGN